MRSHGTLTKWNDDRGFGFISPAAGGAELFAHVSAFPHDGRHPTVGEIVSYETETGADGQTRAVKIMRPGQTSRRQVTRRNDREDKSASIIETVIAVVLFGGMVGYAYTRMHKPESSTPPAPQMTAAQRIRASFECEHHTMCSQMHSCKEARHYLQTCPATQKMDGDGDGIPCEDQLCSVEVD